MSAETMEEIGNQADGVLHEPDGTCAWEDQSGERLDPALVRQARSEEMAYLKQIRVYEKVDESECWAKGEAPIGVRWVDINKRQDQP